MSLVRYFAASILRLFRVIVLIGWVIAALLVLALVFPWLSQARRDGIATRWSRAMLRSIGISLRVSGVKPVGVALLVANHVSWIDPFLILACHPVCFVAKAEIRGWPLLGWLVAQAGTVFIRRDRQRDIATVAHVFEAHLMDGITVGMFPESTTSDGTQLLPFKSALFEVVVSTKADCYPVALRYDHIDAIWVGDMGFLSSIWRVVAHPRITAEIIFCPVIHYHGQHRRELARACQTAIATALCLPVQRIPPGTPDDLPALTR